MKKIVLFIALCIPFSASAQNAWDALRYSQLEYQGTARSMALGNAVTALGGDLGSISINPAGSAIYPYSEFSFTPALSHSQSETVMYGGQYTADDSYTKAGISSFGYVGSHSTGRASGLVQFSFAIGYNKLKDFTARTSARIDNASNSWLSPVATSTDGIASSNLESGDGYDPYYDSGASWRSILAWNTYLLDVLPETNDQYIGASENLNGYDISVGGPLDQRFVKESMGNIGEYLINLGANFSDRVYLGASISLQGVYYKTYENFQESTQSSSQFQTGLVNFNHIYNQTTSGIGCNFKVGIIALPTDNLRLGASIATPTWMSLNDQWSEKMDAEFNQGSESASSPIGSFDYKVRTPWHYNLGIAYTFSQFGLLSFDYEGVDYRSMQMGVPNDSWAFDDENAAIRNGSANYKFCYANNFRIGAELRLNPIVLRAGFNFSGKVESSYAPTKVASFGLGYRGAGSFFTDLCAAFRLTDSEQFTLYDTPEGDYGTQYSRNLKVLLTLGWRF